MRRIDHDPVGFPGFARQLDENAVEHAQAAPTDEPVVDRLVRPVAARRIAPSQAILDDEDDRRHNQPVINSRNTMR